MSNVLDISDKELLLKIIAKLVEDNDLKVLRKLINNNETVQSFKPKELNIRFPIEGYRFTTRGKKLILMKDYYYAKTNNKLKEVIDYISSSAPQ
ncbi:hypothetical protein M9Y10_015462 [Tritrichomonas musculus]|uniref:Uncharacterized protein n=1 Tax=Tritrichomonas musculus TaxID=1915356 RepID=A0ABR2L048_9EUKA